MHFDYSYLLEDGLEVLSALLSGLPVSLLHIAGYVLTALALSTLAKHRGIRHGWLAWIPLVRCWILGSLSDQYRYVVKGEIKSKRKGLLILSILNTLLVLTNLVLIIAMLFLLGTSGFPFSPIPSNGSLQQILGLGSAIAILSLAITGLSITRIVIRFMALSDIYRSMDPENCTLFLVLSILFPVTEPFFLFFNRNKELGMPPRREAVPVQEPWEQESNNF